MGYWGEPTSTTDFCEPNYAVSHYVAEFFNALSSIPLVVVGICGVVHSRRLKLGVEQAACYAVVALVGVGSVSFHATLLRTGQVLDELPMLWIILLFIFALLRADDYRKRLPGGSVATPLLLTVAIGSSMVYFCFGFEMFICSYAGSIVALVALALRKAFFGQAPCDGQTQRMFLLAAAWYLGGVLLLWLPGELLCRRLPWMQRLPMHALFHLTSTAGPHFLLTATALTKFEAQKPKVIPTTLFGGLSAITIDKSG